MPRILDQFVAGFHPRRSWTAALLGALAVAAFLNASHPQKPRRPPAPSPRSRWRPWEGRYLPTLATAIISLAPFIVVTTAYAMFSRQVGADIHASQTALEIIAGLATAGYAWGALLGGDLIQRFRQRELFFLCELLFAIGCLLAAMARSPTGYAAGRILSGFATGLLLVIALPPVFQRFPASKLPITIIFVNIGFFGAVCIGPLLGGWVEAGHHWRWFYGVLGAIGAANIIPAFLCIPLQAAFNPGFRFDWPAVLLGFGAVVLPFWASGELAAYGFTSIHFTAPLFVGAICFIALILIEFHQEQPLSPVKPMWNTYSVSGTLVAMIGGGVFVSMLELAVRFHMQVLHQTPVQTGLLLWPLAPAVLVTAMIFGGILRTRLMPLFLFMGMALLIGAGALLLKLPANGGAGLTMSAAALLGFGAGATVSPGLNIASFPVPNQIIGRVFALVELVRSLADYIMAPVILQIARESSAARLDAHGVHFALWVTVMVTIGCTLAGTLLYILGRGGLPRPDFETWLAHKGPAIQPTPLLARLRSL